MKIFSVPIDYSPSVEKAFRPALDIASKAESAKIRSHIYTPVESILIDISGKRNTHNTQTETNIVKQLKRLIKKAPGDSSGVSVFTISGRTPVLDNIMGFSKNTPLP